MDGDVNAIKYWENTRAGRMERKETVLTNRPYREAIEEVRRGLKLVG